MSESSNASESRWSRPLRTPSPPLQQPSEPDSLSPPPEFHKFMELPPDVRFHIYGDALRSDYGAVVPHLCDDILKFHDDNQPHDHCAVSKLLGITRVSKKLREEALPEFYAANVFLLGKDTASYFDRLEHLGRFQMIRQVRFSVDMRRENIAVSVLRMMRQYTKEVEGFEKGVLEKREKKEKMRELGAGKELSNASGSPSTTTTTILTHKTSPAKPSTSSMIGASFSTLTSHPQYLSGGLSDLSLFILLRKLTSPIPSPTGPYTHKLVLPVPNASIFSSYSKLKWFPAVLHGLGIQLCFTPDKPFDCVDDDVDGSVTMTWSQKFQKKELVSTGMESGGSRDVEGEEGVNAKMYQRVLDMYPHLEDMARPRLRSYYRVGCDGELRRWFDVLTEGGAR